MRKREASLICATVIYFGFFAGIAGAQTDVAASSTEGDQERTVARLEPPSYRIDNRAQYYNQQTWSQLSPWVTRHQVSVLQAADATNGGNEPSAGNPTVVNTVAVNTPAVNTPAVNTPAVTTTHARFGFRDPSVASTPDGWFYDYYAYDPVVYTAANSEMQTYRTASRYHDLNNDGIYDRISNFRDVDFDGSYDIQDHIVFAVADQNVDHDGVSDGPNEAGRHTLNGTIDAKKTARVNGVENLVVRIANVQAVAGAHIDTSVPIVVDLGPAARWPSHALKLGDQLTASGTAERLGDKQVLIAETATIGSQKQVSIFRARPKLEGQVVDVTQAEVKGTEHTIAIVDTASGRQIVDFGPTERLTVPIEPGMRISVEGMPVRIQDHRVILADRIDLFGQQLTVQRW